jgi:hypothetical protein
MRGRKTKQESRAAEFRERLLAWKQTPESMRPSLRAFAVELGTSHQMLTYYLDGLDSWQAEERAKRIRARAEAEGREMTLPECCDAIIAPGLYRQIEKLKQAAKRGPLNYWQIKMLKMFAKQGFSGAKEILGTCRQKTPQHKKSDRPCFQKSSRLCRGGGQNHRTYQSRWWAQDIERLKYFARRKYPEAKELLQKYSQTA